MVNVEELKTIIWEYEHILNNSFINDDFQSLNDRMSNIEAVMIGSGNLLANAKYLQDIKQADLKTTLEEFQEYRNISITTINNYIKSRTYEENFVVNKLERINKTATHLLENLRTRISYLKEELKNIK